MVYPLKLIAHWLTDNGSIIHHRSCEDRRSDVPRTSVDCVGANEWNELILERSLPAFIRHNYQWQFDLCSPGIAGRPPQMSWGDCNYWTSRFVLVLTQKSTRLVHSSPLPSQTNIPREICAVMIPLFWWIRSWSPQQPTRPLIVVSLHLKLVRHSNPLHASPSSCLTVWFRHGRFKKSLDSLWELPSETDPTVSPPSLTRLPIAGVGAYQLVTLWGTSSGTQGEHK